MPRRDDIDIAVGGRIRKRRTELELSQVQVSSALGVTFQQLQKYETGANRVAASRLHALTSILDVPVSYFLDMERYSFVADELPDLYASLAVVDVRRLNEAFLRIEDATIRRAIVSLIETLVP